MKTNEMKNENKWNIKTNENKNPPYQYQYEDAAKTVLMGMLTSTFIKKDLKCFLFFMLTFRL